MSNNNPIFISICAKLSDWLKRLSLILAGVFLLLNIVNIVTSVFFRYFLHNSLVWTEEVARFTLIYAVMFGSVAALSYGEHVSITIVEEYLPDIMGKYMKWFRYICIIGIMGFMTYMGVEYTANAWQFKTLALGIPKAIPLMSMPIGMGLFLVQYILVNIVSEYKQ